MLAVARAAVQTALFVGALASSTGLAASADLPTKAKAAVHYNWTGFYFGGNAGGAWATGDAQWNPQPSPAAFGSNANTSSLKASGFLGGIQAGYNWQFAPAWVAGIEGDWSWGTANSSATTQWTTFAGNTPVPTSATVLERKVDWLASARARFGYLIAPQALLYATGGAAWAKIEYAASATRTDLNYAASTSFSSTLTGYVLGGGLEYALTSHWLLRGEYLFYRFGSQSATAASTAFPAFPSNFSWDATNMHVARAALSYKF